MCLWGHVIPTGRQQRIDLLRKSTVNWSINMAMTENEMESKLREQLERMMTSDDPDNFLDLSSVRTYADVGMLTSNAGLVLRMHDGREFQLTIKRSK